MFAVGTEEWSERLSCVFCGVLNMLSSLTYSSTGLKFIIFLPNKNTRCDTKSDNCMCTSLSISHKKKSFKHALSILIQIYGSAVLKPQNCCLRGVPKTARTRTFICLRKQATSQLHFISTKHSVIHLSTEYSNSVKQSTVK